MRQHIRPIALVSVAVTTAAAVAAALTVTSTEDVDPPAPPPRLDREAARVHADRACAAAREFEEAIERNDSGERVFERLGIAEREARAAVDRDPAWVQLLSGIQSVRYAIEHDDARAAGTGIEIVRRQCSSVRGHAEWPVGRSGD